MKKKKQKSELIKNDVNNNDPILKEVIEYDNNDNETLIKDIAGKQLDKK